MITYLIECKISNERFKQKEVEELPPPGSRGSDDDIAAPYDNLQRRNFKRYDSSRKQKEYCCNEKKKMLDDAIEDASPGFLVIKIRCRNI